MTAQSRSPSGYATWRLIAEELRREIVGGARAPGAKLPPEAELAERFGVHRNTVRQAVSALAAEHLVVSRRGSGTYVAEHTVLVHRIGARTRLSDSLGSRGDASRRLLASAVEPEPPAEVTERLSLGGGAGLRLETASSVDGLPISRGTHWFAADRVPGLAERFSDTGSITAALRAVGIDDYVRAATTVGARHATVAEAADLSLTAGSVVLVTRSLDTLMDGTPLQLGITRFVAARVELDVGHPDLELDGPA
ncbi:phosphonate metabolism transcriptional regulator PhnF [Pseudofrankia asymbiotica]|uniref:Phosphonate metabolism transcriptional regulator PhnF n=2 Tax=Pseudofrankia asymbiotica TaxID=1834516 RepID=A0A1V2ICR3_9ACTN|nr:phosphonate metabolism transcriptional regulator PhnF [Pseudofrankia asymbiotica]